MLTGYLDVAGENALTVAFFAGANTLERVSLRLSDPPDGGTVVAELNTAADGSGNGIEVTIPDGEIFATATGSAAIGAGGYLYLRITTADPDAQTLSGEYEVTTASGVTTMLTTLGHVKADLGITTTDATRDLLLNYCILGVSKRMQDWMDRPIIQTTTTDEKIDSAGDYLIQTKHYPIISVSSLTENTTALVEDTDFELQPEDLERGQIARISGDYPTSWARGTRVVKLTYSHGFAAVPDSLVRAATIASAQAYNETLASGRGWRGLESQGVDPASATSYDKDLWDREIVPAMNPYKRMVA